MQMILIFQRKLSSYRVGFYKQLSKSMDFILCFHTAGNGLNKSYNPSFKHKRVSGYFPFKRMPAFGFLDYISPIIKYKPKAVIVGFDVQIVSNIALLFLRKVFKFKLVLWGQGFSTKRDTFNPKAYLIDKLRHWWYIKADKVIVYTERGKELLSSYVESEKIIVKYNTLDTVKLENIKKSLDTIGVKNIKKSLLFKSKYNLLYVGALSKRKNPEKLIEIFIEVKKSINDISMFIIGEGEMEDMIKNKISNLNIEDIHLLGGIYDDFEVAKYIYASDVMIIPGHVGLVLNHSLTLLTPVVTVERGLEVHSHGPEIEYLINGKNGYIVKSIDEIPMIVMKILNNPLLVVDIKYYIQRYTLPKISIYRMVEAFCEAVD